MSPERVSNSRKHYKKGPAAEPQLAKRQHEYCVRVVKDLLDSDEAYAFSKPVTELWDVEEIPDYFEVVTEPMDLSTVLEDLERMKFTSAKTSLFDYRHFMDAVFLVFENCFKYNEATTGIYKQALDLVELFDARMKSVPRVLPKSSSDDDDDDARRSSSDDDSDEPEEDERIDELARQLDALESKKLESERVLDALDSNKRVAMSDKERMELRDLIEQSEWEVCEQVGYVLRKYVNKALARAKGTDPEFVTIEMSTIDDKLLREVENVVRPNPERTKAVKKLEKLEQDIETVSAQIRTLKRASGALAQSDRKRKRRR